MQVQKIQSSNPRFGYNQTLNVRLVKRLASKKKQLPYFKNLLELNNFTNKIEDQLRQAELNSQESLVESLASIFMELKKTIAGAVEWDFPQLKYSLIEAKTYEEEAKGLGIKDPSHWLYAISEDLKEVEEETREIRTDMENAANQVAEQVQNDEEIVSTGVIRFDELPEEIGKKLQAIMDNLKEGEFISFEQFPEDVKKAIVEKIKSRGLNINSEPEPYELTITDPKVKELVSVYKPTESAKLGFAGLGGMVELKKTLNDRIVNVLKNPLQAKQDALEYGKKMPSGILLYGPPGCGKTTIAEHLSVEAGVPLLKLETGKLKTAYYHETSRNIDTVFDYAESIAKPERPILVMIDDADSFFMSRNSKTSQFEGEEMTTFLNRIQRAGEHNIVIIATTNRYDMMDEAIRSRFEEQIYVGLPDKDARKSVLQLFLNKRTKGKALASDDKAMDMLAEKTKDFPIRALKMMTDKASEEALNDGRRDITYSDFEKMISKNLNMKVKEQQYKTDLERTPVGFASSSK